MTTIRHITPFLIAAALIAFGALLFSFSPAVGNVTRDENTGQPRTETYTFFATSTNQTVFSTSTSATSTDITAWFDTNGRLDNGYFVIRGANRVTFELGREGRLGNQGSSTYRIQLSEDGSNWFYFTDVASATSSDTVAFPYAFTGTTTAMLSLDLTQNVWYAARCLVVEATDGEHFCKAHATWE